jgi:hypothetical protein
MSGKVREVGEIFYATLADTTSLDDSGYVLKFDATNNVVDKAGAGEVPFAVNQKSTADPQNPSSFLTGSQLPEGIPVFRDGMAELQLLATNSAISVGDPVGTAAGGKVNKITISTADVGSLYNSLKSLVGIAMEAKNANSGGKILVDLRIGAIR